MPDQLRTGDDGDVASGAGCPPRQRRPSSIESRSDRDLRGLVRAIRSVSSELDLPTLLQCLVEEARTLVGAQHAAVGVLADDGTLGSLVHTGMDDELVELVGRLVVDPGSSLGGLALLGVPLRIRERVVGSLYLTDPTADSSPDDEQLLLVLGSAAAAAIERQQGLDATRQAAAYQQSLSEERARIARDLHDHSIQSIFAVGLTLNGLARRLPAEESQVLVEAVDRLDDAIRSIRGTIFALRNPALSVRSVRSTLVGLVDELAQGLDLTPALEVAPEVEGRVSPELLADVVAVVREALANVGRHAHASGVVVGVTADGPLVLEVVDDGRGPGDQARSSGVRNMQERAHRWGGDSVVCAGPDGVGTQVRWEVPLSPSGPVATTRAEGPDEP